jgi:hypothetical protein
MFFENVNVHIKNKAWGLTKWFRCHRQTATLLTSLTKFLNAFFENDSLDPLVTFFYKCKGFSLGNILYRIRLVMFE